MTLFQFFPPTLLAVLAGWYGLWRRYRPLFVPLLIFYAGTVAVAIAYVTNNGESYLIPAHITLALAAAVGVACGARALVGLAGRWRQGRRSRRAGVALAGLVGVILAGATLVVNYPQLDRHANYVEEDYGRNAFAAVPAHGLMLIPGDSLNAAALYLQVVRRYRRDVAVIPESLAHSAWWRASFHRHHPDVALPEIPLDAVSSDQQWMTDVIAGLLRRNPGRALYLLTLTGKSIPPGYAAVPAGIGYRVVARSDRVGLRVRRADWDFPAHSLRAAMHPPHDLQQAYNTFAREIQLAYVQAFQNLGDVDFDGRRYVLAARDYTTALAYYPSDPELRLALGASLAMSGRPRQAITYLPNATHVLLGPRASGRQVRAAFALAFNGVGLGYYNAGDYVRALQQFKMSNAMDGAYPDALINLGATLYQQGDDADALVYLQRGVQVAPDNAMIYYNLAQVYARLKRTTLARRMFARAFALNPSLRQAASQ